MKFFISDSDIQTLRREHRDELRAEQEIYTGDTETLRNSCPSYFNFNIPNTVIINIERVRIGEAKYEATEIGYATLASSGPVTLYTTSLCCSRAEHNELMKKFEAAKAAKVALPTKPAKQLLKG
jgi:hypothetical protein